MIADLEVVEVLPAGQQKYSVIWMHGLGADGHDFEAIVPELDLPDSHNIGFIFPHAPIQAVTINNGMKMRSWYDILEMSLQRKVDEEGIYQSSAAIENLIQKQIAQGIASENIILAGFSQGGVVALNTALKAKYKLAGVLALSTYLPILDEVIEFASEENKEIPVFFGHGYMDPVVDMAIGRLVYDKLKTLNYPVSWHEYPMQHGVCQEEIKDISDFIRSVFKLS